MSTALLQMQDDERQVQERLGRVQIDTQQERREQERRMLERLLLVDEPESTVEESGAEQNRVEDATALPADRRVRRAVSNDRRVPPRDMKRLRRKVRYRVTDIDEWGGRLVLVLQDPDNKAETGRYKLPTAYSAVDCQVGDTVQLLSTGFSQSRNLVAQHVLVETADGVPRKVPLVHTMHGEKRKRAGAKLDSASKKRAAGIPHAMLLSSISDQLQHDADARTLLQQNAPSSAFFDQAASATALDLLRQRQHQPPPSPSLLPSSPDLSNMSPLLLGQLGLGSQQQHGQGGQQKLRQHENHSQHEIHPASDLGAFGGAVKKEPGLGSSGLVSPGLSSPQLLPSTPSLQHQQQAQQLPSLQQLEALSTLLANRGNGGNSSSLSHLQSLFGRQYQ